MHAQLGTSQRTLVASSTLHVVPLKKISSLPSGMWSSVIMLKQKARMLLQEWNDHWCNDLVAVMFP